MPETYAASGAMVQAAIIVVQLNQSLAFESIAAGNAAGRECAHWPVEAPPGL